MAGRIVVAVDSPEPGARMLEAAARLAVRRRAELMGLYVEERAFLDLAGFPFSKTLRPGGGWEAVDPATMQRAFETRAAELERELARLAERWRLRWRFQADRGVPAECLLASAQEADMLVLARSRSRQAPRAGSTARQALARSRIPVMILDPALSEPERVTAVFEGDERVLAAADDLARAYERPLEVLAVPAAPDDTTRAEAAAAWLHARGWPERVTRCETGRDLGATLAERAGGVTVVGASDDGELATLVDAARGPVLVVR
ncbi:Universal stress protein family protein [Limimonas halophila]|uniref:Universal stress protein family protein n=1 Tax=Limimonas halophila TaxID=1082479 RepID=A0A1G7P9T0_9PROT|nr:universal stress protein [Limimonas halophila]SDF83075.1 Universal stress protein family protein [Limimonas halophila]